jgi:hypothetical protein
MYLNKVNTELKGKGIEEIKEISREEFDKIGLKKSP